MSKLFTLREWLSLEDTAKYLSNVFNEPVTVSDVLALALDGRIWLSLRFESSIPTREAELINDPANKAACGSSCVTAANGSVFKLKPDIVYVDALFDLPMIGGERDCIKSFEWHNDTEYAWAMPFEEFFVKSDSEKYYIVMERLEESKNKEDFTHISNYIPCFGMPKWARIVVKTKATRALMESLQGNSKKELSSNGEKTYLNIIGAMLELLKSPRPGRVDDASIIRELVDNYGDKYGISESNLNRKLPEAKRSLRGS